MAHGKYQVMTFFSPNMTISTNPIWFGRWGNSGTTEPTTAQEIRAWINGQSTWQLVGDTALTLSNASVDNLRAFEFSIEGSLSQVVSKLNSWIDSPIICPDGSQVVDGGTQDDCPQPPVLLSANYSITFTNSTIGGFSTSIPIGDANQIQTLSNAQNLWTATLIGSGSTAPPILTLQQLIDEINRLLSKVLPPIECNPGFHEENGVCVPDNEAAVLRPPEKKMIVSIILAIMRATT